MVCVYNCLEHYMCDVPCTLCIVGPCHVLKCDQLNHQILMITEEEETKESWDYRNSRGLAGIRADRGMHFSKILCSHASPVSWFIASYR